MAEAVAYPPPSFHFRVDVQDFSHDADIRFQEVSGLVRELGTEELVEGGLNAHVHKLPTRGRNGNLILKRGLALDTELRAWCEAAIGHLTISPRNVIVSLLNEEHEPLMAWTFVGAWPVKLAVSDLKANENAVAIETLELAYRFCTRIGEMDAG
jgi:phage tail-like protein